MPLLNNIIYFSTDQETKVMLEVQMMTKTPIKTLTSAVNFLLDTKVSKQTIIDHPFLLIVPLRKQSGFSFCAFIF
jgi:hypothetical protein